MKQDANMDALEQFVLHNPNLDRLESLLGQFNVFETMNAVNAEVRHSNVLAWLLNPNANHGLGEYFIRQFLKYVVSANRQSLGNRVSVFDFECFDYGDVEIRREWNNIDILVVLTEGKKTLVLAIENKIKSGEHSNQLQRYKSTVEHDYPDAIKLYVLLTPENEIPSDEEWIPFDYGTVSQLLQQLLENRKDSISPNVADFIHQYDTILRRHIVGNSEIEQICRQIYKKHQAALDLIYQYKPDLELEVSEYLSEKLVKVPGIIIDTAGKVYTRFTVEKIDKLVDKVGEGWTKSNRIILFEFYNYKQRLTLNLYIGPGNSDMRTRLRDAFLKDVKLFNKVDRTFGAKWHGVYRRDFLNRNDYEDSTMDDIKPKVDERLKDFFEGDLLKIVSHLQLHWQKAKN